VATSGLAEPVPYGPDVTPRVTTSEFDGPMDLLLTLVRRRELDVSRLSLVEVAGDFQRAIADGALEHDDAAESLVVAATLVELKSVALLPRETRPEVPGLSSVESAGDELVGRLLDYARFAAAADELDRLFELASRRHPRGVTKPPPAEDEFDLSSLTPGLLRDTYEAVTADLARRRPAAHEVSDDDVPADRLREHALVSVNGQALGLRACLESAGSRRAAIGMLLVVLELLRDGLLKLAGDAGLTLQRGDAVDHDAAHDRR